MNPPKLTGEVEARLVTALRGGQSVEFACDHAEISLSSFYGWLARGTLPGRENARYRKFRTAVEAAKAGHEVGLVAVIQQAARKGSWQAALAILERRYPERWAKGARPDELDDSFAALDAQDELAAKRRKRKED